MCHSQVRQQSLQDYKEVDWQLLLTRILRILVNNWGPNWGLETKLKTHLRRDLRCVLSLILSWAFQGVTGQGSSIGKQQWIMDRQVSLIGEYWAVPSEGEWTSRKTAGEFSSGNSSTLAKPELLLKNRQMETLARRSFLRAWETSKEKTNKPHVTAVCTF